MTNLPSEEHSSPEQRPHAAFIFASAHTPGEARQFIGERVRAARMAANLTQQELAGTTYSKSYLSAVERGRMTPSLQALRILAERLGVTLSSFLGEETSDHSCEDHEEDVPVEQPVLLRSLAKQLLHEGRYEEAIALFEHSGQQDRASWAHEQYARFLADQGRYQEAYEQMRRALQETESC